jgi:hypothetical protein
MGGRKWQVALAILAVVLTIALTYASVELPRLVNSFLHESIEFPGFDSGHQLSFNFFNASRPPSLPGLSSRDFS